MATRDLHGVGLYGQLVRLSPGDLASRIVSDVPITFGDVLDASDSYREVCEQRDLSFDATVAAGLARCLSIQCIPLSRYRISTLMSGISDAAARVSA